MANLSMPKLLTKPHVYIRLTSSLANGVAKDTNHKKGGMLMKKNIYIALLVIAVSFLSTINLVAAATEYYVSKNGFVVLVLVNSNDTDVTDKLGEIFRDWQKSDTAAKAIDGTAEMFYGTTDCCQNPVNGVCPKEGMMTMRGVASKADQAVIEGISTDANSDPKRISKAFLEFLRTQGDRKHILH